MQWFTQQIRLTSTLRVRAELHQPEQRLQPSEFVHPVRVRAARFPHRLIPTGPPVDLYHLQRTIPRLQRQQVRVIFFVFGLMLGQLASRRDLDCVFLLWLASAYVPVLFAHDPTGL